MARKNPVRVIRSGLTGTVYALTNYRERENGLLQVNGDGKHDVTADVEAIVAERCAPLVEALESIARNTKGTDDFPIYIAQRALRAHREREGA